MNEADAAQLLKRLEHLEQRLTRLESGPAYTLDQVKYFTDLPPDAVVGWEYAAWRFQTNYDGIRKGCNGSHLIRWESRQPFRALKRDIDRAAVAYANRPTVAQKAAAERERAKSTRRSIMKKAA